jgi:hypothetical protein
MYQFPPNSLDFKKGYKLGVEKGRSVERKLALVLVIGFVFVFELINGLALRFVKCG